MRRIGIDHIVVRVDGRLIKDYTGVSKGLLKVVKHLGFNCNDEAVYLTQDIFGKDFVVAAKMIRYKSFGERFIHPESIVIGRILRNCYHAMIARCYDSINPGYKWYGAKGIKVCEEWLGETGQINFIKWAADSGHTVGLTIDRTNGNLGYSPENCTWMTQTDNSRKTSGAILNIQLAESIREEYALVKTKAAKTKFFNAVAKKYNCSRHTIKGVCTNKNRWQ